MQNESEKFYSNLPPSTPPNPSDFHCKKKNLTRLSRILSPHFIKPPPHQHHSFSSSTPHLLLQLILSSDDDWSKEMQQNLNSTTLKLSNEDVVNVLKKLDKDPKMASGFLNWAVSVNGFKPSSLIYSLMLRIFADKVSLREFWRVVKEVKEKGVYVDEETYLDVLAQFRNQNMISEANSLKRFYCRMVEEKNVDEVVKEVVGMMDIEGDWGVEIEARLRELKFEVSESFVLRVMMGMRGKGCPVEALRFFRWVGERMSYEHNGVSYNGLLRVICQEESIGVFWDVFREMKNKGYEMDLETYTEISRHFLECTMLVEAVELYEHLLDGPCRPSMYDCSPLLNQIADSGSPDTDLVFRVVKKYEEAGYSLSKSVYDGIHRCLTSVGKFDEAEKIIETMKNEGFEPDNITYSQLILGLCKNGKLEEASKVLDLMEEQGFKPDRKTWSTLIQGHCSANEVDKAVLLLTKMTYENIGADDHLLHVIINGFLSQGRVIDAYKLLTEMVTRDHIRPWHATYKNLIPKLLEERKLKESMTLLRQMKKLDYSLSTGPFVEYISKFGTVEEALEYLNSLTTKDYPVIAAYRHLLESFFSEGRHSDAKNLLFKCPYHIRKHKALSFLFGSAESQHNRSHPPQSQVEVEELSS